MWTRLGTYVGTVYYVKENGEDVAIINAVDTVVGCLRLDSTKVQLLPQLLVQKHKY